MKQPDNYADALFMYGLASFYRVSVRIISDIFIEPQIYYLGDTAPTDMITVCFLPSAAHYYASREISPIIIDEPLPLSMEESSPGAPIDSKDDSVIQEIQIQIPSGLTGIPETDTLMQENLLMLVNKEKAHP